MMMIHAANPKRWAMECKFCTRRRTGLILKKTSTQDDDMTEIVDFLVKVLQLNHCFVICLLNFLLKLEQNMIICLVCGYTISNHKFPRYCICCHGDQSAVMSDFNIEVNWHAEPFILNVITQFWQAWSLTAELLTFPSIRSPKNECWSVRASTDFFSGGGVRS